MKKLFLSITMIMCSLVAATAAANTAQFIAYVAEANDASSKDMSIYLENAGYTPAFNNKGEDATKMARVASKPYVYTLIEGKLCGSTGTNNLEGTFIVVCTTDATEYVFSFASVDGRQLHLKDHVTNTITAINNTSTYQFEATANTTIADRFEIIKPAEPMICHRYGQLQVFDYIGNVVIKQMDDTIVGTYPVEGDRVIDLSALAAGQYRVEFNGTTMVIVVKSTAVE